MDAATPSLILALLVLVLALAMRKRRRDRPDYRPRETLLTPAERRFAEALERALPAGVRACPKVRLADVIMRPSGDRSLASLGKIAQKHLDFVLVEERTSRILAAVELDDRSHERPDRVARDRFVDEALESAGVPLLRVKAARGYDSRTLLAPLFGRRAA